MNIYFDNVLIDNDYYTYLDNDYKLFEENASFKLGSTACNNFTLSVDKTKVSSHPSEVKIDDGTSTFYLIVDSVEEDDYTYTYTLVDKLMLFNFDYDASSLIEEKQSSSEDCYLSDILADMCQRVNVTLDSSLTLINNIAVSWYDSTIQARKYLSYIAELQSGYACINEYGVLTIKKHKRASVKTIDIDECSDFTLGEKKSITRVVFDDGVNYWTFGDETGSTLYLDASNVFITGQDVVENIYNEIVGFEFYNIEVSQCPIDSTVRAGDIITFSNGTDNYPTIAQYSISFNGAWTGGYKTSVLTDTQEETKIVGAEENIKKIQSEIDRTNATLTITSQQTDENSSNISTLTQTVNGFTTTIEQVDDLESRTTTVETNIDGINSKIQKIGGTNLIINSVRYYTNKWGDNIFPSYSDTDVKQNTVSKNCFFVGNGTNSQEIQVQNGTYTISWKYKKLINLANVKLKINGEEKVLDKNVWTDGSYTFYVSSNTIQIEIISDTDNSCYLSDLMCNFGEIAQVWSSAQGESVYGKTKMGEMFEAESDVENKRTTLGADGLRGYNTITNEVVFETTTNGSKGKHAEYESSNVAGQVIKKIGNQVTRTVVG